VFNPHSERRAWLSAFHHRVLASHGGVEDRFGGAAVICGERGRSSAVTTAPPTRAPGLITGAMLATGPGAGRRTAVKQCHRDALPAGSRGSGDLDIASPDAQTRR